MQVTRIGRVVGLSGLLFGAAGVAFHVGRHVVVRAQSGRDVSVPSFRFEREQTAYTEIQSGQLIRREVVLQARNGARSVRTVAVLHGLGESPTRKLIFPDGRMVIVNDSAKMMVTNQSPQADMARWKRQMTSQNGRHCGEPMEVLLERTSLLGQKTEVWQYQSVPSSGNVVSRMITHRAVDLNCIDLRREEQERTRSGEWKTKWDETPSRLVLGDVDPSEFEIPADYREVMPSEFVLATQRTAALIAEAEKLCAQGRCTEQERSVVEQQRAQLKTLDEQHRARRRGSR